ncbi:MAG: hypothetical protein E4H00_01380 [Myxococcales bacterium]|nr:MAG: hypothetical protein E4H00_01380 [Myxococcales bacterium]
MRDFQAYGSCGDEWIAGYDRHLALECDDLFGDCDSALEPLDECVRLANNRIYFEATCPELDITRCEQSITECSQFAAVSDYCERNCPTQDRQQCIEQTLSAGMCGDAPPIVDAGVIPNRG